MGIMAEFESTPKIKYAVCIHDIKTEKKVFEGAIHLRSSIDKFMHKLFERGWILTNHYRLDEGCQPKIIQLGKVN
jgi:predicted GNAT superfamily acetyltransferase